MNEDTTSPVTTLEGQNTIPENQVQDQNVSPETSQTVSDEGSDVSLSDRKMLAEARQTRQMILDFQSAVESGTYSGHKMRAVATGLAFLEVLLRQNTGHIKTLQDRVG